MRHRYESIIDGIVVDRITCDSQEDLIKCMKVLKPFQKEVTIKQE